MSSRRRRVRTLAPTVLVPFDRERALAKYAWLVSRSVTLGFVAIGPLVQAETPEELADAFADWLSAEVGDGPPS